ncbi:MAG: hypothetical protein KKE93_03155 [Nanoarchaeota archaeon]|nr:hypothetical protein [Nanoarchaeota archaeon]
MIEREELASRVNKIMETYVLCPNLVNKQKIFYEFYNKLTTPQNFKEEWGGIFAPSSSGPIRLNMTPEHIDQYFEVLTKKLDSYKKRIETNKINCKNYKTPEFEPVTASELAREAFYESFPPVKNSYKRDKNNKLANVGDDLFDVYNRRSKGKEKGVDELTPEDTAQLKKLQRLHLGKWEIGKI